MSASTKRQNRISEEIKKALGKIFYQDLSEAKLRMVTISKVKISSDLSIATIYYTTLTKNPDEMKTLDKLLRKSNKEIRMHLSKKLKIRAVPQLKFFYDDTLDSVYKIEEILKQINNDEE